MTDAFILILLKFIEIDTCILNLTNKTVLCDCSGHFEGYLVLVVNSLLRFTYVINYIGDF